MAERNHKSGLLWVSCIAFLLIAALYFTVSISASNEIPRVLEYSRSRISPGISFSTYEKMTDATYGENMAICGELEPVEVDGIGEVKPALVNEYYFDVYHIFVSGSAVTADHTANKIPAAVISDKAAFRMSLDSNVIGRTVSLFGKDFTIVGVYHTPDSFLQTISADVYDRVYIPYTAFNDYRDVPVDTLAAPKGTYYAKALRLLGMTGSDTGFYLENDLAVKHDITANFADFFIAVFALIFALFAIRIIIGLFRKSYRKLHDDSQNDYLPALLRRNWRHILSRVLIALLLLSVPVALLILFPPKLILPANFIPYDNIFELKHYYDTFVGEIQRSNAGLSVGNGYFRHLFSNAMILLIPAFVILTVWLIRIMTRLKKRIQIK